MTFAIKGGGVLRAPNPAENCDYFLILISAALSLSLSLSFLLSVSLIISIIYHALFITLKLILNITLTINHISISISFVISININIYISIRTCTTTRTCKTNVRKPNMKGHFSMSLDWTDGIKAAFNSILYCIRGQHTWKRIYSTPMSGAGGVIVHSPLFGANVHVHTST